MKGFTGILAASTLALALAAPAAAQTAPAEKPADKTMESAPATTESRPLGNPQSGDTLIKQDEGQIIASDIIGTPVLDTNAQPVGEIADLVLDEQQMVVGAILRVGGFLGLGAKSVAVPWSALRIEQRDEGQVALSAMSEEELAAAPEFQTLEAQKAAAEAELQRQKQLQMQQRQGSSPTSQ